MSARIVFTTWGSYGDLNPTLGLAIGLRARGHRVVIATSARYRTEVEREGVDFHPVRPDVDPADRTMIARVMDQRRGTEYLFRELLMRNLRASYDDLKGALRGADVIVTHPATMAAPLLAQELALPWVSLVLAPISFMSAHDMPVLPPAPWLRHLTDRSPWISRAVAGIARRATQPWVRPVSDLRKARGLPPGAHPIYEGQHSPHLVLALFSRVLAVPQPDWPRNVRVVGAVPYNGPDPSALRDDLEAFLASGSPPVVFTLGTSAVGAAGTFYDESLGAVERLGMRAVLLIGGHPENRPARPLPASVIAVEFARHAALFPRAALVVHQGGAGTLHQALAASHPMLVVPHAHDQPDNAHRVTRLGVARTLAKQHYRAARVAGEIATLLGDPRYRAKAAQVAAVVRGEDAVRTGCDAIEQVALRS